MFSFDQRQIFASQIFIHRGKFLRDFGKSGKPPSPPAARHLLVRLRRGQAICRLAQLARLLIRNGAGRGERGRISGRFAELTLRGCRLSPNRRSLLFGLACGAAFSAYRCLFCPATSASIRVGGSSDLVEFVSRVEGSPREAGSARERGGAVFIQLGSGACSDAASVRKAASIAADVEET